MANQDYSNLPEEFRPIGAWGYFGYALLFSIPCVGFILLLIFSLGGAKNINLRNYARSYFCMLLIGLIVWIITLIVIVAMGGTAAIMSNGY